MAPLIDSAWDSSSDECASVGDSTASSAYTECESIDASEGVLSTIWEESTTDETDSRNGPLLMDESLRNSERSWTVAVGDLAPDFDTSLRDSAHQDDWNNRSLTSGEQVQYPTSDDEYTFASVESDFIKIPPPTRRWSTDDYSYESISIDEEDSIETASIASDQILPLPDPDASPTKLRRRNSNQSYESISTSSLDPADETSKTAHKFLRRHSPALEQVVSSYFIGNEDSDEEDKGDSCRSKSRSTRTEPPPRPVRKLSMEFKVLEEDGAITPTSARSLMDAKSGHESNTAAAAGPRAPIRKKSVESFAAAHDLPENLLQPQSNDQLLESSSDHLIKSISVPSDDEQKDAHAVLEEHLLKIGNRPLTEPLQESRQRQKLRFDMARCVLSPRIEKMHSSRAFNLEKQIQVAIPDLPEAAGAKPAQLPTFMSPIRHHSYNAPKRIRIRSMRFNSMRALGHLSGNELVSPSKASEEPSQHTSATDLTSADFIFEDTSDSFRTSSFHNISSKTGLGSIACHVAMTGILEPVPKEPESQQPKTDQSKLKRSASIRNKSPRVFFAKSLGRSKRKLLNLFKTSKSDSQIPVQ